VKELVILLMLKFSSKFRKFAEYGIMRSSLHVPFLIAGMLSVVRMCGFPRNPLISV
jgi:hypothetical protein